MNTQIENKEQLFGYEIPQLVIFIENQAKNIVSKSREHYQQI
jgi:hypothetical protein